ncbi:High-affinity choline transporter 1 [Armadillidium vulgare]|nr:High-affinity choline transporter 1 [Armadillidium vulgare]
MAISVGGLIVICFFYAVIFLIGIWAAWKRRAKKQDTDETMLAGRSLGTFVGVMTLTASWVGGGYINGSAEAVYESGLVWCQVPFGSSIGLALGGIFFAKKMRDARYVTMLDPFQNLFGKRWGSMLFFPALAGEMLYSAAILAALDMYIFSYRTTMAVMLNLNSTLSIIISAAIAASYTIFGGLAAVAYTDVVQLFCIFMGLRKQNITLNNIKKVTSPKADVESDMVNDTAVNLILNPAKSYFHPFENILIDSEQRNEAVSVNFDYEKWLGSIDTNTYELGEWFDFSFLLIFGSIPWQICSLNLFIPVRSVNKCGRVATL